MPYQATEAAVQEIRAFVGVHPDLAALWNEVVARAVRYARIRTDWRLSTNEERMQNDAMRTAAHDAFIDSVNILARGIVEAGGTAPWRGALGNDRRVIGDFACHLHSILGIEAR